MQDAFRLVERVAPRDATVLLRGESGTGKEVFARLIHHKSARSAGPFLAVNCAALPESLLESELFGHEKGAFTGAVATRAGLFREAEGGTLFLDEIGEVTTNVQVKLLRAIQEKEVLPVGGRGPVAADVRIIAATNQDLDAGIREGWFREDLYYRLSVFPIHTPPLRRRREDVAPLAEHFLARGGYAAMRFSAEAMRRLMAYDWPGNVRELENVVERSALMADGAEIGVGELPPHVAGPGAGGAPGGAADLQGAAGVFVLPEAGVHLESLEEDLIRALSSGHLAGAAVDVVRGEQDSDISRNPLIRYARTHPGLIVAPHIAGLTVDSQRKAMAFAAGEIARFFRIRGGSP
jgi:DNA-binding NtrC family response regulator